MVKLKNLDISHDELQQQNIQAIYARILRKKQIFFRDLFEVRAEREKIFLEKLNKLVGPKWYHVLSVSQMQALDCLKDSIHQDILSGQPNLVSRDLIVLGLDCNLSKPELITSIYLGRKDEKEMLAHMFLLLNGHTFDLKRESYSHCSKLILSSIFYLGLKDIIKRLVERFRPDIIKKPEKPKLKRKSKKSISPYLDKTYIPIYNPKPKKRAAPAPLPVDLSVLNDVVEEEALAPVPPPPPPPPPKPKKRIPKSVCDKIAGIFSIPTYEPEKSTNVSVAKKRQSVRQLRARHKIEQSGTKKYGLNLNFERITKKTKTIKLPQCDTWNRQHHITGVSSVNDKPVYVLGNISILPATGDTIHGGFAYVMGTSVNIHLGIRAFIPEKKSDPCDCMKYHDLVIDYVKSTKCQCGHYYDYRNEGNFPKDELQFFNKPTRASGFSFDLHNIFQTDPKTNLVQKDFINVWETDSILNLSRPESPEDDEDNDEKEVNTAGDTAAAGVGGGAAADAGGGAAADTRAKSNKKKKKDAVMEGPPEPTCLGDKPRVRDYLKCALNLMRHDNLAAKLPDVYLAPELLEWMRHRIYGPYSPEQRKYITKLSRNYSERYIRYLDNHWHIPLPKLGDYYTKPNTWAETMKLKQHFKQYTKQYRHAVFLAHAKEANLYWATMFTNKIPNNKLREIYYAYLFARDVDMTIEHPYNSQEVISQYEMKVKRLYRCPLRTE